MCDVNINPRPLIVCCVLAVPCFAMGVALRDRQPDTPTFEAARYVVAPPVTTVVVPDNPLGMVVSPPPAPAAVVTRPADRGVIIQITDTVPPPPRLGLHGLPLAPVHLEGCAEAKFYRQQAGLIEHFDGLAWRESGCETGARNWCCTGHYQIHKLWVSKLAHCEIWVRDDLVDPQRNACAAAHIYEVQGAQAWSAW